MLKFSNKTFYSRHRRDMKKYIIHKKSLHIINSFSKNKIVLDECDELIIDFTTESISKILEINNKYETIILTDVIEISDDIFGLLKNVKSILLPNGKLIISSINYKWSIFLKIFEKLKTKDFTGKYSYIHNKKIKNIASGVGFEYLSSTSRQIFPFHFFKIGTFVNKSLEALLFFLNFGIKTYIVLRNKGQDIYKHSKTIIIPAKNEEGNLVELVDRIPKLEKYEIIIACGESQDKTFEKAQEIMSNESFFNIKVIQQTKTGKANAVWESLDISSGELVAILDADISVDPETIPSFFEIIDQNEADFVNGTRLIYEMEHGAMRRINLFGNRVFQSIIGFIIKKDLTDSLCGTKVFRKSLIPRIKWWQNEYNVNDPFGDFDLLFSAAYTGEKIIEFPVHYRSRKYGKTQISRFKDGFKLIKYLLKSYFIFNTTTE